MKRSFLVIAMAIAGLNALGQDPWIKGRDSLLKILPGMKEDSSKVWILLKLGVLYLNNQPDSAAYYARAVERLSEKVNLPAGIANGLSMQAVLLADQNRTDEAIAMDLRAIEFAKKSPLKVLANIYNNVAIIYNGKGDHSEALDFYLKAAGIFEQTQDSSSMAFIYGNIAGVYNDLHEFNKGYFFSLKGISLCRLLGQEHGLGSGLINLSNSLINLKRYDTALIVLDQTKTFTRNTHDVDEQISTLANIDYAYVGLEKFTPLKANADELMSLARSVGSKDGICYALFGLTYYYVHEKRYDKAGRYIHDAIDTAKKNNLVISLRAAYKQAGEVEIARGNLAGYNHYNDLKDSIDDVLLSDKILKNTQELDAKYSLKKKQSEIDDLNEQKKTRELILRQRIIVNWALAGLVLVIVLTGFLYRRNYRQNKKLLEADATLQRQFISQLEKEKQLLAAQAVLQGQVEERSRLARDLHDGLGSILSGAKYSFTNMKENMIITPENAEAFERSMGMLDRSITELRRVAHNMMPEALMKFGLDTALKDFCNSVDQSGAVQLTYQSFEIEEASIPPIVSSAVYRIIQELVNNILKHADATTALVQVVRKDNTLSIAVEDNGKGFDTAILQTIAGIGWLNLRNRVAYLNGTIDIQTATGKGTSVNIEIKNIAT